MKNDSHLNDLMQMPVNARSRLMPFNAALTIIKHKLEYFFLNFCFDCTLPSCLYRRSLDNKQQSSLEPREYLREIYHRVL